MDYISAKEASVLWKITDQMIRRHCRNGRIPGSVQKDGVWYVPADAKKPTKLKPDITPIPKLVKQLQFQPSGEQPSHAHPGGGSLQERQGLDGL